MFDLKKLEYNRKKSKKIIESSKFYQFVNNDIIDRLEPIKHTFNDILIIEPAIEVIITRRLIQMLGEFNIQSVQNLNHKLPTNKFDLIIFPLGFHSINDVQNFLQKIALILKDDGIFICSFPGDSSLRNLRRKLIDLEILYNLKNTIHISPFIKFEHVTPLLQQSGFIEHIIDMEKIELEHNSPLDLMKAIKKHGESNILTLGARYSITKKMYFSLQDITNKPFIDYINLITFVASTQKRNIQLKDFTRSYTEYRQES